MTQKQRNKNYIISCLNHLGPCTYKKIGGNPRYLCVAMKELEREGLVKRLKARPAVYELDCYMSTRHSLSQWERFKIIWKGFFSF